MRNPTSWLAGLLAVSLITMGSSAARAQVPHSTQDDVDHSTQDISTNWNGHSTQDVLSTVPGYGLPSSSAGWSNGLGGSEISPASGAVPEPTSALLMLGGAVLLRRRRR